MTDLAKDQNRAHIEKGARYNEMTPRSADGSVAGGAIIDPNSVHGNKMPSGILNPNSVPKL